MSGHKNARPPKRTGREGTCAQPVARSAAREQSAVTLYGNSRRPLIGRAISHEPVRRGSSAVKNAAARRNSRRTPLRLGPVPVRPLALGIGRTLWPKRRPRGSSARFNSAVGRRCGHLTISPRSPRMAPCASVSMASRWSR